MSITFYCPDSPRTEQCNCGSCDADDLSWSTHKHECNFANGNAFDVLRLIGRFNEDDPYCGLWKAQDLPAIQRSIMQALNIDKQREYLVRPPKTDSRIIYQGNTDEQTIYRLEALQTLVAYAAKNNYDIFYG